VGRLDLSDTTGMQRDSFKMTPALADGHGANHGTYLNGPTLGVTGGITGDSNTAAQFDGVNDYGTVARQISDDFSIEFWFKSTQGIGTGAQWWEGAGLVDAEVAGSAKDFGVSLRSDGRVVAGVGPTDTSIVSPAGTAYNNGNWHHVVFTRTRTSGAFQLYVDGIFASSATGSTASLTEAANINLGRIQAGNNYFAGSLDEVATYSTALSQPAVTAHFNAGKKTWVVRRRLGVALTRRVVHDVRPPGGAGQDERDDQTGEPHDHEDDADRGQLDPADRRRHRGQQWRLLPPFINSH
jgi:hypothetical protein